jgi:hypothetical protein
VISQFKLATPNVSVSERDPDSDTTKTLKRYFAERGECQVSSEVGDSLSERSSSKFDQDSDLKDSVLTDELSFRAPMTHSTMSYRNLMPTIFSSRGKARKGEKEAKILCSLGLDFVSEVNDL